MLNFDVIGANPARDAVNVISASGSIVLVSSTAGQRGEAYHSDYAATKGAIISFTKSLAVELGPRDINVNCVAPGWVDTEMAVLGMTQGATHAKVTFDEFKDRQIGAVPIKRIIDPAEVAGLVTFLCSPEAAAITGQTYNICGGQTMA